MVHCILIANEIQFEKNAAQMFARISTYFGTTEEKFWNEIVKLESLRFVSHPILSFEPRDQNALDDNWVLGKTYPLKLRFLNLIPLGDHGIKLVAIDREANTIISNESGSLSPLWNHTIKFRQVEVDKLPYVDEIEIKAR